MSEISPLFVLEAEQLLLTGFVDEAIELCKEGLSVYPDYTTAKILLEKAYTLKDEQKRTSNIINQVDEYEFSEDNKDIEKQNEEKNYIFELNNSSEYETINTLESDILEYTKDNSEISIINEDSGFEEINNSKIEDIQSISIQSNIINKQNDNELLSPMECIAKLIASRSNKSTIKETSKSNQIVYTETMAQILLKQGKSEEAKEIYYKLIEREPEKEDYYRSKIADIFEI